MVKIHKVGSFGGRILIHGQNTQTQEFSVQPLWACRGRLGVLVCVRARSQMGTPPTPHFRITLYTLTASHLHCTAGSSRSFTALRKDAGLYCGSRLLEGRSACLCWAKSKPKVPKGLTQNELESVGESVCGVCGHHL